VHWDFDNMKFDEIVDDETSLKKVKFNDDDYSAPF
jgi:hypothetical protein